ncbi:hypothetical protein C8R46DRAFT_1219087 [Mycena filopes]|nr:hypothetical protein C8R46DRAFT_1219087 [Mycena filopes]
MVFFSLFVSLALSILLSSVVAQQVRCPDSDKLGSHLNTTAPPPDPEGFTSCVYPPFRSGEADNLCEYSSNGTFHNGSSNCPDSAAFFAFYCLSYDGLAFSGHPDGNPLGYSYNDTADDKGYLTYCFYKEQAVGGSDPCPYSQIDGSLIVNDQTNAGCPPTINTAHLNSTGYNCSSTDNKGNSLIGASVTVSQELACTYYDFTASSGYQLFANVDFSKVLGMAPLAAVRPVQSRFPVPETPRGLFHYLLPSPFTHDTSASSSTSSTSDINSNKVAVAAAAAAAASAATPDSKKATGSGVPKPVFIALLATNAFLVVAILLMGGIWIFRGPSGSAATHGYEKVVLARGLDDDSYLDVPGLPYRPPSRM